MGNVLIFSTIDHLNNGKWEGFWSVGNRNGKAVFDTEEEAREFCKRSINRETGFGD